MELLAHWWNGSWGTMTRCDVWLEQSPDGQLQIRWRGDEWRDRDGLFRTRDLAQAMDALRELLVADYKWSVIGGTQREALISPDP